MYYVFLRLAAIIPMMDFGFSLSIERSLAYALGGAGSIQAHGVGRAPVQSQPNAELARDIVVSARRLYWGLAAGGLVLMGLIGTWLVGTTVHQTSRPEITWTAWAVYAASSALEIYTGYWVAVLRGFNYVTLGARWMSIAYGVKLAFAIVFLLAGGGLLAVPVAGLISSFVLRAGAGRAVRRLVPASHGRHAPSAARVARLLWPNSWRLGVQLLALFVSINVYTWICSHRFGLETMGRYGLSVQVMQIAIGIAAVWTSVKWPLIAGLRIRDDREGMRRVLWPRFWLQILTFLALAFAAVWFGPPVLAAIGSDTTLLPTGLLWLLLLDALGQLNFSWWTTLISTENRIPALWALVATHAIGVVVVVILVFGLGWGLRALVVTPLVLGALFNYWWWAREGARVLGTTLPRFLMGPWVPSPG
jgi:O-antigen/teichoic acid export membrane protein